MKMFRGCCSCRYKKLVDNIFPINPQDGLVKNNMDKLMFYAITTPDKLDRIGKYLCNRAARYIYKRRPTLVFIAMAAMDQLFLACHGLVDSFLKMVQELLGSSEPELQILATKSFVIFANIKEETPSYCLRYDFFIIKFSAMSVSTEDDQIRIAGIKGIQAVLRNAVSDDLIGNIWKQAHLDKIITSLLFNMQDLPFANKDECQTEHCMLAEICMCEIISCASFGHIRPVLTPVLTYFDRHNLWTSENNSDISPFVVHTFRIIMFSIQPQNSYTVVQMLMVHLEENNKSDSVIRSCIAGVLSKIIAIAASEIVGPSVYEIINSLLNQLKDSIKQDTVEEKRYQEALTEALQDFANHLPDYQKIQIMMFVMGEIPFPIINNRTPDENLLQSTLLKILLKVGTKYQTIHFDSTFEEPFLELLLNMSLAPDPHMRLLVQKILHRLIDRHENLQKLLKPTVNPSELQLNLEKSSTRDLIFINKYGSLIYETLYTSLQMDTNTPENVGAVYTTLALLSIELANPETTIDLLQFLLGIQSFALTSRTLPKYLKCNLHAIAISLLVLVAKVGNIPTLMEYAKSVTAARKRKAPHLIPDLWLHYSQKIEIPAAVNTPTMIDQILVCTHLTNKGLNPSRLMKRPSFDDIRSQIVTKGQRNMWIKNTIDGFLKLPSTEELNIEYSSPRVAKVFENDLKFESIKKRLTGQIEWRREAEAARRKKLNEAFRNASFQEIVRKTRSDNDMRSKLNEAFNSLAERRVLEKSEKDEIPAYERYFPELFNY